jgi:tetratricopeptide (TPR) repeat protein
VDEALAEIKRAQELDPLSPVLEVNLGLLYIARHDFDAAKEHATRLVELDPNFPLAHHISGCVFLMQGRYAEAIAEFQQDVAKDRSAYSLSHLGHSLGMAGRRDEALAVLKELEAMHNKRQSLAQYVAGVYSGLGDKDQAFTWLEKGFKDRTGLLDFVLTDTPFEPLRSDPRYADLVRRMGLKP